MSKKAKVKKLVDYSIFVWSITVLLFLGIVIFENVINKAEPFKSDLSNGVLILDITVGVISFCIAIFSAFISLFFSDQSNVIDEKVVKSKISKNTLYSKLENELSDVIFVPKRKTYGITHLVIGLIILSLAAVLLANIFSQDQPINEATKETLPNAINKLFITDIDSKWVGQNLFVTGVIKNDNSQIVNNVQIRVDFFGDSENKNLFDTRFFVVESLLPNSAFSFENAMNIQPKYKQWWYTLTVVNADY